MKLYKSTQHSYLLYILSSVIILAQLIPLIMIESYRNSQALLISIFVSVIFIIVCLVFGKLTIVITENTISGYFNLRLFQQKMKLSDIDISSIKILKPPIIYGIGLRFTPLGTLYNVKFGKAIHFSSKDKSKTFFVGSDEVEKIKSILEKHLV